MTTTSRDGTNDPYGALGVARTASDADIKSAYRTLAKKYHPDLHQNAQWAKREFQEISAAYDILSDPEKRTKFDRFGSSGKDSGSGRRDSHDYDRNGSGNNDDDGFWWSNSRRSSSGSAGSRSSRSSHSSSNDGGARKPRLEKEGKRDRKSYLTDRYTVRLTFSEAAVGGDCTVHTDDGYILVVKIPTGVKSGALLRPSQTSRLRSVGPAEVRISVKRDPVFSRSGNEVITKIPISLRQAFLGGRIKVPTIHGHVSVDLKPNLGSNGQFRLRGYGIDGADQVVAFHVDIPRTREPELEAFLTTWVPRNAASQ